MQTKSVQRASVLVQLMDPPCFLVSSFVSHPFSIFWLLRPRAGTTLPGRPQHKQSVVLLDTEKMRMWARSPLETLSLCASLSALSFHSTKDPQISADVSLRFFLLSTWEETPNHHRSRITYFWVHNPSNPEELKELQHHQTLKRSKRSSETASGHSVNASIVHLT